MNFHDLAGQSLGPYELRELLGAGGMGAVYRAVQTNLRREVAIKVLSSALAEQPGYLERFNREANIAAALEHPHIVPVYDHGAQNNISYVVMRLLAGGSLADRLRRAASTKQLPSIGEVSDLLEQVAGALDYAHSRGVIHRDIKPSNLMFDNHGNTYVVDFGIAKLLDATSGLTGTGQTLGTPSYMPPEQWRDDDLTPAADQYALGVLVYNMITGHLPFEASTPFALMHKHLNESPLPPHALRDELPRAVTLVLERALAKRPEDRFPTVTAFSQAFDAATEGMKGGVTGFFYATPQPRLMDDSPTVTPAPAPAHRAQAPYAPSSRSQSVMDTPTVPPATPTIPPMPAAQPKRGNFALWGAGVIILLLVGAIIFLLTNDRTPPPPTATDTAATNVPETPPAVIVLNPTDIPTEEATDSANAVVVETEAITPSDEATENIPIVVETEAAPTEVTENASVLSETEAATTAPTDEATEAVIDILTVEATEVAPTGTAVEQTAAVVVAQASETPEPTATDAPTNTPVPTATDTDEPTATLTDTATDEPTATPTDTATDEPSATSTDTPTETPTSTPSPTETPTPTDTDTPVPTLTPLPTETPFSPTPAPTLTPVTVICVVNVAPEAGINLRSRPANTAAPGLFLPGGTKANVVRVTSEGGENWYFALTEVDDVIAQGWIRADQVIEVSPCSGDSAEPTPQQVAVSANAVNVDFDQRIEGTGWSYPEVFGGTTYIWMNRTESTLQLDLTAGVEYTLSFRVVGEMAAGIMDSIQLSANGTPIPLTYRDETGGARVYEGTLPADAVSNQTTLRFSIDRVISPMSMQQSNDARTLGVMFDWLRLEPGGGVAVVEGSPSAPINTDVVGAISFGETAAGTLTDADGDAWTFEARAGDEVLISLTSADFDTELEVINPAGQQQAVSEGEDNVGNSFLHITAETSGTYIINAHSHEASASGNYWLYAGLRPPQNPIALLPEGTMQSLVQWGILDSVIGQLTETIEAEMIDLTGIDNTFRWKRLENTYGDFVLSATMHWGPGDVSDTCGFSLREVNPQNYYALEIDRNGTLWFTEFLDGQWQQPQQVSMPAIDTTPGASNVVTLVARGNMFEVIINNDGYQTFQDNTNLNGSVGLGATTFEGSDETRCTFTDVWAWSLR